VANNILVPKFWYKYTGLRKLHTGLRKTIIWRQFLVTGSESR